MSAGAQVGATAEAGSAPRPPAGELVDQQVLYTLAQSVLSLAQGFAGQTNPTTIWQSMISDDRTAYQYYRELEEKDDDVGGAIEEMKLSVTRRAHQLTPADDSQLALEVKQFVEDQLNAVKLGAVIDALLEAPFYGLAVCENVYDVSAGQVGLTAIHDCPQELFAFAEYNQPQIGPLRLRMTIGELNGELVPENKFLVASWKPRARNRRGRPLLRAAFWPSWFKRKVQVFWLRFGEKGPGTAAVMYPQGAGEDEQQKALAAAEAIVTKVAVAVPENFKLVEALLTGARAQNPAVYKQLFDECKYAIARRIKGQTLTSFGNEGGTGSRAMGDTHEETKGERSVAMAKLVEDTINEQLVRPLVFWNFGPNAPMPKWAIDTNPPVDLKQRSEIDNLLQQMGVPIPLSYARETYGVPEPRPSADGDDVLVRSQAGVLAPGDGLRAPAGAEFSDVRVDAKQVQKLLDQARAEGEDLYRQRILQLIEGVQAEVRR